MKKSVIILLAVMAVLLCSCGSQKRANTEPSGTKTEAAAVQESPEDLPSEPLSSESATSDQPAPSDGTNAPLAAAERPPKTAVKPPLIDDRQFEYEGPPEKQSYEDVVSRAVGKVVEEEGTYAASPVIWSTISDQNFLYFFYRFTGEVESSEQELSDYVIVGEHMELACGIHPGMSIEDVEDLLPGLYHYKWDEAEDNNRYQWNNAAYPEGFCEQFPTILMAQSDNGEELPLYIGFMADETNVIRAIGFCHPTAG